MKTILKNACYLPPQGGFVPGDIVLEGQAIRSVGGTAGRTGRVIDIDGYKVIPGLVDIHTHGAAGHDAMTASPEAFAAWSRFLAENGVTSFLPATVAAEKSAVLRALGNIKAASRLSALCASIEGAHIEGPYINKAYRGCHDPRFIADPSVADAMEFADTLGKGMVARFTVAPELDGAMDFIRRMTAYGCYISLGHSGANFETAIQAVENGANCFTHLFNGMAGFHHRAPGIAGAGLLCGAYAEIICDGVHLHPDTVRLVLRAKGVEGVIAVTDSMPAAGKGDGSYAFGGGAVRVTGGVARTPEGNLAGSTLMLKDAVKYLARFVPLEAAVRAATVNPARAVGLDRLIGTIEAGKRADLLVIDDDFNILYTFCRGRIVYAASENFIRRDETKHTS